MSHSNQRRTAFVLAGGGSLGAVEVGMIKALFEGGIEPDLVVGASVGAINGAFLASHPGRAGVDGLEGVWRDLRRADVFPLALLGGLLGVVGRKSHFLDSKGLRSLLERHIRAHRLEEMAIPCHMVATDVLSGEEVRLSSGSTIEALLASAAIPAVFPPVRIGDRYLVDGAMASNTPISAAIQFGGERLIVLPTGYSCAIERPPTSALAMALHAVNLLTAHQLTVDIERFRPVVEIVVVPPLCPLEVSSADFSRSVHLIGRAQTTTRRWLEQGGLGSSEVPPALRPHSHARSEGLGTPQAG